MLIKRCLVVNDGSFLTNRPRFIAKKLCSASDNPLLASHVVADYEAPYGHTRHRRNSCGPSFATVQAGLSLADHGYPQCDVRQYEECATKIFEFEVPSMPRSLNITLPRNVEATRALQMSAASGWSQCLIVVSTCELRSLRDWTSPR